MKIVLAADHGGLDVKNLAARWCKRHGHEIIDIGVTEESTPVDYPDYAASACNSVAEGKADRAILVCTNGIGMCMAANKIHGIRAALVRTADNAERSRAHNDANVLCLAGKADIALNLELLLYAWFNTEFEGGRHQRRVEKLTQLEK